MTIYGQLGDLSDEQLQAALDRFDLGPLGHAEALTEGLFGKNVALTSDIGRWVLRGDPWPTHVDHQYRRERFFARAIRDGCDVPVPWPYFIEPDESLFGWPYAIIPRMPGRHDRTAQGAVALGRTAAALRAVTFPHFGEWAPESDDLVPFDGTASEWLSLRLERWIADTPRLVDSDLTVLRDLVPPDLDCEPGYVHHDLKPGNCVVTDGAVTGLFDLGEGYAGDAIEDLARTCWDLGRDDPALAVAFVRSYEGAAGIRVPIDRLRAYTVFDLLVIWSFGTRPDQQWFKEPTFEAWLPTLLSSADRAFQMLLDGR